LLDILKENYIEDLKLFVKKLKSWKINMQVKI